MNINQMKRIASRSSHERCNHASLIFAGSRLLVYGYNTKDRHAEIVAIRRLEALLRNNNKRRPKNLHMVNLMIKKKTGNFGFSYPCDDCYRAAMFAGIKTITCFDDDGIAWEWFDYSRTRTGKFRMVGGAF